MTKQKLNIARLVLVAVLVLSLVSAVGLVVFAEDAEPIAPQTRDFNKNFDRMLDDVKLGDIRAAYRSVTWTAGDCAEPENHPIFKIGSGALESGFTTFAIELRSPDESVKLADLRLALRDGAEDGLVSDTSAFDLSEISWLLEGDEITDEWTTFLFKPGDGDVVNSINAPSTAEKAFPGFHLYSVDTKGGTLDIRAIKVDETTIYDFADINNSYWRGTDDQATVVDYPNSYVVTSFKQIVSAEAASNNTDGKYDAIVLSLAGSGNVTVAPVVDGEAGAPVAWADLTDLDGTAVAAIGDTYVNHVIKLESLGETAIEGVEIAVTDGEVYVAQAFFTNMESRAIDKDFPVIDVNSIQYVSQFTTETTTKGSDQFESIMETFAGDEYCLYALSDSPVKIEIANGHAILDAKDGGYTNLKVYARDEMSGQKYLVIKYKLENGATLAAFRFGMVYTDRDGAVTVEKWVKDDVVFAGFGLLSTSDVNPYTASNGYQYLIVDLESTFGDVADSLDFQGINLYFGGAGQMLIDEIYFADACGTKLDLDNKVVFDDYTSMPAGTGDGGNYYWFNTDGASENFSIEDGALKIEVPEGTAVRIGGAKPDNNNKDANYPYMVIRMKGDIDMSTFRIVWLDEGNSTNYAKDFVTLNDKKYVLGEDYSDLIIDLDASGIDRAIEGFHLWVGNEDSEAGTLYIDEIYFAEALLPELDLDNKVVFDDYASIPAGADNGGSYWWTDIEGAREHLSIVDGALKIEVPATTALCIGGAKPGNNKDANYPLMVIRMKSENLDMDTFRIEWENTSKTTSYANKGGFVTLSGKEYVLSEEYADFIIDLDASGIDRDIEGFRLWLGGWNAEAGTLYIDEIYFTDYYRAALPTNDDSKPVITHNIAATGTVGTEITLSATATDNYDENVQISFSVTLGTTPVTVTNGKFTPAQAGTYAVEITATDAAGNVAKETVSIVVAAAQTTDPGTTDSNGLSTGAIVGIVLGCVAVVAAGVVAFILIRKKKAGK